MSAGRVRSSLRQVVPWLWLAMSLAWAVVVVVTDELAWPLALWVATTAGPLTYLRTSRNQSGPRGSSTKGTQE